jgi:hypothetical protein
MSRSAVRVRSSALYTALQQIECAARECPLEILSAAEGFLAPHRQRVQLTKPRVVDVPGGLMTLRLARASRR